MFPTKPSLSASACAALCAVVLSGCFPDDPGIPEPDVCGQPSNGAIDSIELGEAALDQVFVPWQDGDSVTLAFGPQGGAMLPVRLRVRGTESTCVDQEITIADPEGTVLLEFDFPMRLYAQDDGSMVSNTNYAIFDLTPANDSLVTVSAVLAQETVTRTIRVLW